MVTSKTVFKFITLMCLSLTAMAVDENHNGVMSANHVNGSEKGSTFCIQYNPKFKELPPLQESAESMNLVNLLGSEYEHLCDKPSRSLPLLNGSAVAVKRGNCTFSEKAALVQSLGGSAVLIVSPQLHIPNANSSSDYNTTRIIVAMISVDDFESVEDIGGNLSVKFYAPDVSKFDINLLFILLTAVFAVTVGSFWSGNLRYMIWLRKMGLGAGPGPQWQISEDEAKTEVQYSPSVIIFAVITMCAMILGLYFLYDYLIYVIIVLFGLGASFALHDCLKFFMVVAMPPFATCRIPPNQIYWLRKRPEVRDIVLICLCLAFGLWWMIERHKSYAWVLQDILGVAFCIEMMKSIRLPSLKICSILMILLFVYDVFFVFITPLLTRDGSSVMVDIATGRGSKSGEKIPIVLMFPKMLLDDLSVCFFPFSLLGFGDVLVPGLLVSYCYGFDLQVSSKGVYFYTTVTGYAVGLVMTFVALMIMNKGQPALLYLVPCTLVPVLLLALARKELRPMWSGKPKPKDLPAATESVSLSRSDSPASLRRQIAAETDDSYLDYSSAGEEERMLGQK